MIFLHFSSPFLKFTPLIGDIIKVIEYYLSDFLSVPRRHSKCKNFFNIEHILIDPVFALHPTFLAMHMHRLIAFIGIEEQAPSA